MTISYLYFILPIVDFSSQYSRTNPDDKIVGPHYFIKSLSNNISADFFTHVRRCVRRDRSIQ